MYLGPLCYCYAINSHLVYLAIPGTRPLCMKKHNLFVIINATSKSEIQICSNKHETCLVDKPDARKPLDFNLLRISTEFLIDQNKFLPFLS